MSYQVICEQAEAHPAKTAVVADGNAVSYRAFAQAVHDTISHLETGESLAGRTVVIRIRSLIDSWVAVLALQSLGAITVCGSSDSIIGNLSLENVAAIVTTESDVDCAPDERSSGSGGRVIVLPAPVYDSGGDVMPPPVATAKTGGHILYTSGTTGSYKKIFLDAALQRQRNAERIESYGHYTGDTAYHCTGFGLWTAVGYKFPLCVWQAGGTVIFEQRSPWCGYFLSSMATHAILVPDQVNELLAYLDVSPSSIPSRSIHLAVSSGFIFNQTVGELLGNIAGCLENLYAATETNGPLLRSLVTDPDDLHWMTPAGYRAVEIVDEQDIVCPAGVEGQLRIRLTALDCSEYMDNPPAAAAAFRSGYFYPGDMAMQREDGRIRILGRSVDVLNIFGQKHAAAPIEHRIREQLGVDAVCVFSGLSNDGAVEYLIVIETDAAPDSSAINDVLQEFSRYGNARMTMVPEFPRTLTGTSKVDRVALRKQVFPTR